MHNGRSGEIKVSIAVTNAINHVTQLGGDPQLSFAITIRWLFAWKHYVARERDIGQHRRPTQMIETDRLCTRWWIAWTQGSGTRAWRPIGGSILDDGHLRPGSFGWLPNHHASPCPVPVSGIAAGSIGNPALHSKWWFHRGRGLGHGAWGMGMGIGKPMIRRLPRPAPVTPGAGPIAVCVINPCLSLPGRRAGQG